MAKTSRQNRLSPSAKILVTGSSGLLGNEFIKLLTARGIGFIRHDRAGPPPRHFHYVVHFSGITPVSAPKDAGPEAYGEANVEGTRKLLAIAAANRKLKRFVNIGSASEYGFSRKAFREGAVEKPRSNYGKSKLAQTRLVEAFAKQSGVSTVNLRVFNIAGLRARREPGSSSHAPTIFDSLIEQLEHGSKVRLSNSRIVRDFVALPDIAEAVLAALEAPGLRGYHLINVASGIGTSLGDVARGIGTLLGRQPKIVNRTRSINRSVGDPAKAARLLGWRARISLPQAMAEMVGRRNRVVIVGAGVAGRAMARELRKAGDSGIVVAGFVDDDLRKRNLKVGETRVLGTLADLPGLIREHGITQLLVSTPSVGTAVAARAAELVPPGFPIRVLPSATSVLLGTPHLSQVRDIDPSDLVGRPLVKADQKMIAAKAHAKTFLVTGGAGSIGSEIVRQLNSSGARRVVIFDSWEEGVFNLMQELKQVPGAELVACLGNIRDRERLGNVFGRYKPDAVIHAAAYKHVPLLEENREEAVKTNIDGTRNVLDMVVKHKVPDFVLISTDKAVRPASVLGETKRAAEILVKDYAKIQKKHRLMAVRFGNVLNSSGSVIPTFLRQIRNRQPITLTDLKATRYFMSIPEAVSLVLLCWIVGKSGQILLLDMGEPASIHELAQRLIRIHGLVPYRDVPIKVIGLRPGEKLHEELSYKKNLKRASVDRIFIAEEPGAYF